MRYRGQGDGFAGRSRAAVGLLTAAVLLGGCGAATAMTLVGVGAGVGTRSAISYTMDGIAYKTFTASEPEMREATLAALGKMDLKVLPPEPPEDGATPRILAKRIDRQIEIELEPISSRTTRLRVVAKEGIFFKDKATATEIIYQVGNALEARGSPVSSMLTRGGPP